jgi:type IV fimbrial biogenesis protein FimT
MVTVAIAAILMALAVPSMLKLIARKRVEGVASELASDLRYLRSVNIQRSAKVRINFDAHGSCYVLSTVGIDFDTCDCTRVGQAICQGEAGDAVELKTVVMPASSGVSITANPLQLDIYGFNGMPLSGATLNATVQSSVGGQVRVFTDGTAKPTICSVSGPANSLPPC